MEDNFTRILTVSSRFEADLIEGALQEEGIPFLLLSHEETAYNGIFIPQKGWGTLLVPESRKQAALDVVNPLIESLAEEGVRDV